ncbi:MAG: ams [Ferruginibacter sp.]|nr:ams [Ferruginibacter sp.]
MYNSRIHQLINTSLREKKIDWAGKDNLLYTRFIANAESMHFLYNELYGHHPKQEEIFGTLIDTVATAYANRSPALKQTDRKKEDAGHWFLSNEITGMSLYVDRFCGSLGNLEKKLYYFKDLGVNLLHLMPLMESPAGESDGGYAVADFRKVDKRFGTLEDLQQLQAEMSDSNMYLVMDIVLNHTSHHHQWAQKAKEGHQQYQEYFYMYDDRTIPDEFDKTMPDIFPESSPGNFSWVPECNKWAMTVFHNYQWDLNYSNPLVFIEMLDTVFFYANLGVDILRIDAPAFIWKQMGTTCQNLPLAHTILQLIKQCVHTATPGMALLGEAIVSPREIMKYFGTGAYTTKECDFAYNATQMALQWDALATGDSRIMLAAQDELLQKPFGASWITYTRCHDDIGLGYDDHLIAEAGFTPYDHRKFLKDYYAGIYVGSPAMGALFSVNPKTQDARISGSLASLCGLEKAIHENYSAGIQISIDKILLMQAHSFFIGGIPMLFYGDEAGYTNDYSYLEDPAKSYDNRWMHRPVIDWERNKQTAVEGTVEQRIFSGTRRLIEIRKSLEVVSDHKNLYWLRPHNIHVAGFLRSHGEAGLYCVFNYSDKTAFLTWAAFKEHGLVPARLYDHWNDKYFDVGLDHEYLVMPPFSFNILEP